MYWPDALYDNYVKIQASVERGQEKDSGCQW